MFARQAEINARPLGAVQLEVEQMLADNVNWTTEASTSVVDRFDPATNAFFTKYRAVVAEADLVRIDIDLIEDSPYAGFLVVGTCADDGRLLLNKTSGEIVEVDLSESPAQGMRYTTVFHYLLMCITSWADDEHKAGADGVHD